MMDEKGWKALFRIAFASGVSGLSKRTGGMTVFIIIALNMDSG